MVSSFDPFATWGRRAFNLLKNIPAKDHELLGQCGRRVLIKKLSSVVWYPVKAGGNHSGPPSGHSGDEGPTYEYQLQVKSAIQLTPLLHRTLSNPSRTTLPPALHCILLWRTCLIFGKLHAVCSGVESSGQAFADSILTRGGSLTPIHEGNLAQQGFWV